ncbi:MAG TPA: hypothetical protein VGI81_16020, partial [Tepidisphaeraceae bacterium]
MRASFPLTAERGRIRAIIAALCAMAALAVVAAMAPPSAHAAFTVGKCQGAPVAGQGSSAQKEAQLEFWSTTVWHSSTEGCGSSAPAVTYAPEGSGCGIASIGGAATTAECFDFKITESGPGKRAESTRFGGSDAPLTVTQQTNADDPGGEKPGVIHQIPVASFAVAIIVHFPDGCKLKNPAQTGGNGGTSTGGYPVPRSKEEEEKEPLVAGEEDRNNDPVGGYTGDKYSEETLRVRIPAVEMEKIWDGESVKWE